MLKIALIFLPFMMYAEETLPPVPNQITQEWEKNVLGVVQGVLDAQVALEEHIHGINDQYFDKALLDRVASDIKKNNSGTYIEYWPNGKIKLKFTYKNGKPDGHLHGWFENGFDAFKGHYKEGLKQGVHISFYPPWPFGEGRYVRNEAKRITYKVDGAISGRQILRYKGEGNQLKLYIEYSDGNPNGSFIFWRDNIKSMEQLIGVTYKNGVLQKEPAPKAGGNRPNPFGSYLDKIVKSFENEVLGEYRIAATSSGADMPADLEGVHVGFNIRKDGATIAEAREWVVKLSNKLANMINANEDIRPYLRDYPFGLDRIQVSISFRIYDPGYAKVHKQRVSYVNQANGIYYYHADDPQKEYESIDLYKETVEEAERKVKLQQEKKSKGQPI